MERRREFRTGILDGLLIRASVESNSFPIFGRTSVRREFPAQNQHD